MVKVCVGPIDLFFWRCSPEAQAWNLAMFGNNRFFAFCISYRGIDEILPEWELASGLAFSESKMAALKSIFLNNSIQSIQFILF